MSEWNSTGYHEIRLEHKQILFVFLIAAVIGVALFLLGVMVGRKSPAETAAAEGTEVVEKVKAEAPKPAVDHTTEASFFDKPSKQPAAVNEEQPAATPPVARAVDHHAETPPPPTPKPGHYYSIQSGAFSTEANAKHSAVELEKAGYPITILPPGAKDTKKLYRVLVGEFATRDEAIGAKKRLEGMGFKNLVVR